MKIHVIHLEPHDDADSVKDKMSWAQSERIILDWPARNDSLHRKLDLQLLLRHSRAMSAQIGIVTRDQKVLHHAAELGVPVFRSVRQAQRNEWEITPVGQPVQAKPKRRALKELQAARQESARPKIENPLARLSLFVLGVAGFLAILAALLPSAEIRLRPQIEQQTLTLAVTADPRLTHYTLSGGLAAENLDIAVEGRGTRAASGTMNIPERAASGEVLFTNLTSQALTIPAGTVVRTLDSNPILFATTQDVELAAEANAAASAAVEASNPGTQGNLPAGSLAAIDGPLGLSISVTNPEPTSGGSDVEAPAPSPEDYDALREELLAELWQNALDEARSQIGAQDVVISSELIVVETLEETFEPAEPQPADELALTLRVRFEVIVIRWESLEALLNAVMDASIPAGYIAREGTLSATFVGQPVFAEDGTASWTLQSTREIAEEVDEESILAIAAGQSLPQAAEKLQSTLGLASPPEIILRPAWWPRLPLIPLRIAVIIE